MKIRSIPKLGDIGPDVLNLQARLAALNFSAGKADGIFGPKVVSAVSRFQKAHGLQGTGVLGPKTLALLGLELEATHVDGRSPITKDLKGKQDRHVQPHLRLLIEDQLFPNGEIPQCFKDRDVSRCYIAATTAVNQLVIHEEGGNNKGELVGEVQGTTGAYTPGGNGDAWCEDLQQTIIAIIEDFFQRESPIKSTPSCWQAWQAAVKVPELTTQTPTPGTMALGNHPGTELGHAMACVAVNPDGTMKTFEGNTSVTNMTDGDGAGFKVRNQHKNGSLVTLGFVYIYPGNVVPA